MKCFALVFLALAAMPANAGAQSEAIPQANTSASWAPPSGSRVRLTSVLDKRQIGTLVFANNDSLVLRLAQSSTPFAVRTHVTRLEVSRGMHTTMGKSALKWFVLLGGPAFAITAATWNAKTAGFIDWGRWGDATIPGTFFGVIGAVIGANRGARPSESWQTVSIPRT